MVSGTFYNPGLVEILWCALVSKSQQKDDNDDSEILCLYRAILVQNMSMFMTVFYKTEE